MTESELLTLLLDKPGLYIGYGSVVRVDSFIKGFSFAREEPPDAHYKGFGKWLRGRFEIRQDLDWVSIVSLVGQSEARSFSLARELWEEYRKENPVR